MKGGRQRQLGPWAGRHLGVSTAGIWTIVGWFLARLGGSVVTFMIIALALLLAYNTLPRVPWLNPAKPPKAAGSGIVGDRAGITIGDPTGIAGVPGRVKGRPRRGERLADLPALSVHGVTVGLETAGGVLFGRPPEA